MDTWKKLLLIAVATGVTSFAFSEPDFVTPCDVRREDGTPIHYYLQPKNPGRRSPALLVILQGSDCNSVRKVAAIQKLRTAYPESDLLTVEKYGVTEALGFSDLPERPDCPEGYLLRDNPEQRADDADSVIRSLRQWGSYSSIVVIGGSEGSVVANLLTARAPYVSATVLFAGGGRFFRDDVLHSLKFTSKTPEDAKKDAAGFTGFAEYIATHEPFELSMGNHGYRWWKTMLSVDQEQLLASVATPVFIVQGGEDQAASPEKATEMVDSLVSQGKRNITYRLYPGYNHSLNLSLGDGSSDKVIEDIRKWLGENLR